MTTGADSRAGAAAGFHILTVCLGNVCRSPLMERLLLARLPDGFTVSSAGLIALEGRPMEPNAAAELARLGGSDAGFVARDFTPRYADVADLVLTATAEIRSRVLAESPGALRRTFTLPELAHLLRTAPAFDDPRELVAWAAAHRSTAAGEPTDVPDPIGRGPEVHRQAADAIDAATGDRGAGAGVGSARRLTSSGYAWVVSIFALPSMIMAVVSLAMFVAQAFAFVDAISHRADAYVAADKLTKNAWLIILGLAVAAHMLIWSPLSLFNLVGIVAALVYIVDVRPALRSLTSR